MLTVVELTGAVPEKESDRNRAVDPTAEPRWVCCYSLRKPAYSRLETTAMEVSVVVDVAVAARCPSRTDGVPLRAT